MAAARAGSGPSHGPWDHAAGGVAQPATHPQRPGRGESRRVFRRLRAPARRPRAPAESAARYSSGFRGPRRVLGSSVPSSVRRSLECVPNPLAEVGQETSHGPGRWSLGSLKSWCAIYAVASSGSSGIVRTPSNAIHAPSPASACTAIEIFIRGPETATRRSPP